MLLARGLEALVGPVRRASSGGCGGFAGRVGRRGLGADASIDAAGVPSALSASFRSTRPDGRVVVVAHHHQPLALRSGQLIFNEIALTGSSIYDTDDISWVIEAMQRGAYPLDEWITTIELDRVVEDGFTALREQRVNKVLVRLDESADTDPR